MSFNQSRGDRSDSSQYRRGGRPSSFSQKNSNYSGSSGKGGGAAAPPQPSNLQPNRSFSKKSNNVQGGQSRAGEYGLNVNLDPSSASASRPAPNGSPLQPPISAPYAQVTSKPTTEQSAQRSSQVTNAPTQAPNVKPDPAPQATPTKAPGDASKSFPIQFGSVSPGTLNGMQIPARTSSAPPNLVEQQRDQARRDAPRQAPQIPIPSIPKQQIPRKDTNSGDQPKSNDPHQVPKPRTNIQAPSPSPTTQSQKNPQVHNNNIPGISMPMQFHHHQPQIPVQFNNPNPQIPIQLPIGNAPQFPRPVYVSGLHPHQIQAQGMIHHGPGLNYPAQMGPPQMPPQLGNLGMGGSGPQFPRVQVSKFDNSRKPIKITHPDTHEELRLGNTSGPRSSQNIPKAQPVTSVPSARPINYFANPVFFPNQGPVPINNPSSQPPPRVSFPASQGPQAATFINPSNKQKVLDNSHDVQKTVPSVPQASVPVTIKPATVALADKMSNLEISVSSVEKVLPQKHGEASSVNQEKPLPSVTSVSVEEPVPVVSHVTENIKKETYTRGDSIKEHGKKQTRKESSQPSLQVPEQSAPVSSLSSQSLAPSKISDTKAFDSLPTEPIGEHNDASTQGESLNNEAPKKYDNKSSTPSESASSNVSEVGKQPEIIADVKTSAPEAVSPDVVQKGTEALSISSKKDITEVSPAPLVPEGDVNNSKPEITIGKSESLDSSPAVITDDGVAPVLSISLPEPTLKTEEGTEDVNAGLVSLSKPAAELIRSKNSLGKGKKKLKEILQKADAAGTTSDLYNAYKRPEEKKEETIASSDNMEVSVDSAQDIVISSEKGGIGKAEPDDWEDAADISTPKIEIADNIKVSDDDVNGLMAKKYSRDFLLKFSEQFIDLPDGFEIASDIADTVMTNNNNNNISRESYPSPGRVVDRSPGGPRRGVVAGDEDRWHKPPGPLISGRDIRMEGHGGNFRPGQGGNHGVLRNIRGQPSGQYNNNAGGILSGPMQPMGSQAGMQRSNSDADRWQRATGFQKGLIPSPQTPVPVMHKAERKYLVGKVTDEEEAKQRQLKGILNKLTPQNFEKLFEQVKAVNIDNAGTLTGVISQIFDKALTEPTFCEMYANFCFYLSGELPDFSEDNEKITFKRILLNKCQEEFERGEREQEEADRVEVEGEAQLSPAEREEKRVQARRRMLGNIRLIGELYKKRMLTERIMHECIKKLLGEYQNPDEEDIEALCKLMSTIGEMIDHPKAKEHIDAYFEMMLRLSNNMKLSSRVRFMLKDAIDLRKNKWQQRRKIEGPKKIEDVHRDAAQERQVQATRLGRGPGPNSSGRSRQPMEFTPRGSNNLVSPNSQMGNYRGLQSQPRGYGIQDARIDDRHSFESRTLSLQRPLGEESIMLGPQGGLARGMSSRGQPLTPNAPLVERPGSGDSRRVGPGLNGFGSVPDRSDPRFSGSHDQGAILDRNTSFGNRNADRTGSRSRPSSPSVGGAGIISTQNISSDKVLSEERLREKSLSTIKEFYSIKDEKEVAMCVKEFNAPSFYPTMISLWVSDSFERKDMERESLAKLLTNLSKSRDSLLNHDHLIKGFESVLSTLEDAVNDAPKAGEFLGRIMAKIITEDVIPFPEIGQLIYDGGEEQGSLVEAGLAAEVVGTILEIVKSEKGEPFLNEIRISSGLKLERFRPPNSKKTLKLDKFI